MRTHKDIQLSKEEQAVLIGKLLDDTKKDLLSAIVQEWIYSQEYAKPKHITKQKALENMGIYQKRIRLLKEHVIVYEEYAKYYDIMIK